mmetsp:Transcript_33098/g.65210  ORF Transcript_33098/g.65210 Transcript_33098/m.65210 type:complete len:241 (-) Transcript_33098:321-1043(-)
MLATQEFPAACTRSFQVTRAGTTVWNGVQSGCLVNILLKQCLLHPPQSPACRRCRHAAVSLQRTRMIFQVGNTVCLHEAYVGYLYHQAPVLVVSLLLLQRLESSFTTSYNFFKACSFQVQRYLTTANCIDSLDKVCTNRFCFLRPALELGELRLNPQALLAFLLKRRQCVLAECDRLLETCRALGGCCVSPIRMRSLRDAIVASKPCDALAKMYHFARHQFEAAKALFASPLWLLALQSH